MATSIIGASVPRIDGGLKVTGGAKYALDHRLENVAYGVPVASTVASAHIRSVDTSQAESMPGVLAILHHGNADPIFRAERGAGESRPPLSDDVVYYYGQYVALVVAETLEQAHAAAARVKVEYDARPQSIVLDGPIPPASGDPVAHYSRGDADQAYASAGVKIDETYTIPPEMHNPMEMHATIADWQGDWVTLYETTQAVVNNQHVASAMLGLPLNQVRILSPFCGSGFGGKLGVWPQSPLAAMGARKVKRPVKVQVPRSLMFTSVGYRPSTQQRMRLAATQDGKLLSIRQDVIQPTSMLSEFIEHALSPAGTLYTCADVSASQWVMGRNVGTPAPMRGPGTCPGLYALESAMDDLAIKLNMDPLELRLKNYAEKDQTENLPFSSKQLRACYEKGAEKFGWSKRNPKVGSMRNGDEILGWGMATSTWHAGRGSADVRVRLLADGSAQASSATQDIGTGTYTVMAQAVADKTGLPIEKVTVVLGDSSLPPGPTSGGSTATASVLPAVAAATEDAIEQVLQAASKTSGSPFVNSDPKTLAMTGGRIHSRGQAPESGVPFEKILAMRQLAALEGQAHTSPERNQHEFAFHSFGAHFVEVAWDPGIARLRVSRTVTVMDVGKIINPMTARNQVLGGVVMGIGMAMFEGTHYDPRNGKPLNNNFADYLVATNADVPQMECEFVEVPDYHLNEFGLRGVGEIGITGVAPAITMAAYHATGIRVRKLPIRIEDLLSSEPGIKRV